MEDGKYWNKGDNSILKKVRSVVVKNYIDQSRNKLIVLRSQESKEMSLAENEISLEQIKRFYYSNFLDLPHTKNVDFAAHKIQEVKNAMVDLYKQMS